MPGRTLPGRREGSNTLLTWRFSHAQFNCDAAPAFGTHTASRVAPDVCAADKCGQRAIFK
jgi:hypothetical protein